MSICVRRGKLVFRTPLANHPSLLTPANTHTHPLVFCKSEFGGPVAPKHTKFKMSSFFWWVGEIHTSSLRSFGTLYFNS